MPVSIRTLKRRYKIHLALGRALPPHDLGFPLPFSTGNPLYDAALTEKLSATRTMSEAEHLRRTWDLARAATAEETRVLALHSRGLLNDFRLLMALRCWEQEDDEGAAAFLRALPWARRLGFPTAVIKPSATVFTGWRRSLRFRLVDEPRFPALRELYRQLLRQAPPVIILKYRAAIQEAAALMKYRFEGARERAIHAWCFENQTAGASDAGLSLLGAYADARTTLRESGPGALATLLEGAPETLPLTSYAGLLGSAGVHLREDAQAAVVPLRDYAVRSATPVESLLRLRQWAPWLQERHTETLAQTVRAAVLEGGLEVPFHRVTQAYMSAPIELRKRVLEPLYLPLLRHFGRQVAGLLPPPGPLTYVQPGNALQSMSLLLYAAVASAADTRMLLLYRDGVEEVPGLTLDRISPHLADDPWELQQWLLAEFGGLATQHDRHYDLGAAARVLKGLDPRAPLLLNVPMWDNEPWLAALLPFEQVFNLNGAVGAPGEVSVAQDYYVQMHWGGTRGAGGSRAGADGAALRFAELLDRLRMFQTLAEAPGAGDPA